MTRALDWWLGDRAALIPDLSWAHTVEVMTSFQTLSVSHGGSFSLLSAFLCPPYLCLWCSASALAGQLPVIAGWLTMVKEVRSQYIFGHEKMGICKCIWMYIFVPTSPSIYSPTYLFLPQTEDATGIMFFGWDPPSAWTQRLVLKTPLKFCHVCSLSQT